MKGAIFMALGNKEIMSRNIKYYLQKSGKTRNDLVADLNLKYMTVSDWINGKTYPRIDKIEMLANYFGVMKSDLVEDRSTAQQIVENYIVDKIVDTVKELDPEPYQRNVLTCAERSKSKLRRDLLKSMKCLSSTSHTTTTTSLYLLVQDNI